jgi:hypothetical protein
MDVMARTHVGDANPPELSIRYTTATVKLGDGRDMTILQTANPDPTNQKTLGPYEADGHTPRFTGAKCTLSCQPNGTLEVRPENAWADFEVVARDAAGNVTFWPGQAYPQSPGIPVAERGTCYKFLGALNVPVLRP